jgi:hypothetical protein
MLTFLPAEYSVNSNQELILPYGYYFDPYYGHNSKRGHIVHDNIIVGIYINFNWLPCHPSSIYYMNKYKAYYESIAESKT